MDGLSAGSGGAKPEMDLDRGRFIGAPAPRPHRTVDVLEFQFTGIDERHADLSGHLRVDAVRNENAAGRRLAFQSGGNVHTVAENVVAIH